MPIDCDMGILTYFYSILFRLSGFEPILVMLKIKYRLSQCYEAFAASQTTLLHIKRLNQIEFRIFVILCSKGNPFLTFICMDTVKDGVNGHMLTLMHYTNEN